MKAVVKEDRSELSSDGSPLPEGNCVILLTQVKIKAGVKAVVDKVAALKTQFVKTITDAFAKIRTEAKKG
jgi:hypothetical protein